jgi:hypothetical protein
MNHTKDATKFKLDYEEGYGYYVDDAFTSSKKNPIKPNWGCGHWKGKKVWWLAHKWLLSHVGEDVDRVFQKFVTRINMYSKDVRAYLHIEWEFYIYNCVEIVGGTVYSLGENCRTTRLPVGKMYIHPVTKIIMRVMPANEATGMPKKHTLPVKIESGKGKYRRKTTFVHSLVWYDVRVGCGEFVKVAYPCWKKIVEKPYLRGTATSVDGGYLNTTVWELGTIAVKSVASKREIRKHKLNEKVVT